MGEDSMVVFRVAIIVAVSVLFGYSAGVVVAPTSGMFGLGGRVGAGAGSVLAVVAAACLRRKPLPRALGLWLGPTGLLIAVIGPWVAPWLTLALASLFAFALCAAIFVQVEDFDAIGPNQCERCRYDLLGVEGDVCPECGLPRPLYRDDSGAARPTCHQ